MENFNGVSTNQIVLRHQNGIFQFESQTSHSPGTPCACDEKLLFSDVVHCSTKLDPAKQTYHIEEEKWLIKVRILLCVLDDS